MKKANYNLTNIAIRREDKEKFILICKKLGYKQYILLSRIIKKLSEKYLPRQEDVAK